VKYDVPDMSDDEIANLRGELAPLDAQAHTMTAAQFAAAHDAPTKTWGRYLRVRVGGTDYLWRLDDKTYDGWERYTGPPGEEPESTRQGGTP